MAKKKQPVKRPVGRPKAIKNPAHMLELFNEYVAWNDNNPLTKMDFKGKDADEVHYRIDRPLSWFGFDAYLFKNKIIQDTEDYRHNTGGRYTDFKGVIKGIGNVIKATQVEGALTGLLKENLVARLNGIKDQVDTDTKLTIEETKIGFE